MEKESYFNISANEQSEILQYYSDKLSRRDIILEKDIWLCWVLDVIFNIPNRHPMAFKGGTSLSKVFGAINRFSEDVDITLDYRSFDISSSFSLNMSKTQAKLFSEKLKKSVNTQKSELKEKIIKVEEKIIANAVSDFLNGYLVIEDNKVINLRG